jgi:hypothetical protein
VQLWQFYSFSMPLRLQAKEIAFGSREYKAPSAAGSNVGLGLLRGRE